MGRNRKDRKAHLKKRMSQRYNIKMTKEDRAQIKQSIKGDDVILVEQSNDNCKIYDVPYKGMLVRVVYNEKLDQIVTVITGPDSVRFRVEYVDQNNEIAFTEIEADGKIWAAQKAICLYNPKKKSSL
jgi:hypothetical protein